MDALAHRPEPGTFTGAAAIRSVAAAIGIMFAGSAVLTPLYVLYQDKFHFSALTLTSIYAVYVVGNLTALLFLGRLSDRLGRRRTILPTIAAAACSTLLFLFAHDTAWLYWGRMLSGLAIGLASGTATAWLAELYAGPDKSRATLIATTANLGGLAVGALISGLLVQYAPWPLQLPHLVYLAVLLLLAMLVARTCETVRAANEAGTLSLRPRLGIDASIRVQFIAPAATAFGTFSILGYYSALGPSVLLESLHQTNRALGGGVIFELCIVAMATVIATRSLRSRSAMVSALLLLPVSVWLLVAAQALASLPLLLTGAAIGGVSSALGYRGSLQVINQIAPAERRAETVSSYLIVCYLGNSVPIVGVGVLSKHLDTLTASIVFACMIVAAAVAALVITFVYAPERRSEKSPA